MREIGPRARLLLLEHGFDGLEERMRVEARAIARQRLLKPRRAAIKVEHRGFEGDGALLQELEQRLRESIGLGIRDGREAETIRQSFAHRGPEKVGVTLQQGLKWLDRSNQKQRFREPCAVPGDRVGLPPEGVEPGLVEIGRCETGIIDRRKR